MRQNQNEQGFSYVDVMIAITILLVGMMALTSAITTGVVATTTSQQQLTAKQFVQSTIESIFSARDLSTLGFSSIANVGDGTLPGGVFLAGQQYIYPSAGPDGVVGTADDSAGPDGIVGTADDLPPVAGFQRQITVVSIVDPARPTIPAPQRTMRAITVTVSYYVGTRQFQESMTAYVASYRTQ